MLCLAKRKAKNLEHLYRKILMVNQRTAALESTCGPQDFPGQSNAPGESSPQEFYGQSIASVQLVQRVIQVWNWKQLRKQHRQTWKEYTCMIKDSVASRGYNHKWCFTVLSNHLYSFVPPWNLKMLLILKLSQGMQIWTERVAFP